MPTILVHPAGFEKNQVLDAESMIRVQKAFDVSDATVRRLLNEMEKNGLIKQVGDSRATHYILKQ